MGPRYYDREWISPEAALCATLWEVVDATGYTEAELERTSPAFIERVLIGRAGARKAEAELNELAEAASKPRDRPH